MSVIVRDFNIKQNCIIATIKRDSSQTDRGAGQKTIRVKQLSEFNEITTEWNNNDIVNHTTITCRHITV